MRALRSMLVGLPDDVLVRVVRAATDPVALRHLVQVAMHLDDGEGEAVEEAPAPRRHRDPKPAKRARKAAEEAPRGPRPSKGTGVQRLLEALRGGPKTTSELAEALGISKSGVRQAAKKAGKLVRSSRSGKSDAVLEAAR